MPNPVHCNFASSWFPPGAQNVATYLTPDQNNDIFRGAKFLINVTVGGTLTVTIQGKDQVSGLYYNMLASTALGVGTTQLTIYPSIAAVANVAISDVLPATWRLSMVVGTSAVTATIGGSLLI